MQITACGIISNFISHLVVVITALKSIKICHFRANFLSLIFLKGNVMSGTYR